MECAGHTCANGMPDSGGAPCRKRTGWIIKRRTLHSGDKIGVPNRRRLQVRLGQAMWIGSVYRVNESGDRPSPVVPTGAKGNLELTSGLLL